MRAIKYTAFFLIVIVRLMIYMLFAIQFGLNRIINKEDKSYWHDLKTVFSECKLSIKGYWDSFQKDIKGGE